jgi:MoaA/NifB/PqqE/SkfB family radical SAM enzyme
MTIAQPIEDTSISAELRLLWVELTSTCNPACVHCYAESGLQVRDHNPLTTAEYLAVLDAASAAGCTAVQFIGGEPTLYRDLPVLLRHVRASGFTHIEVFTNATHISEHLQDCIKEKEAASVAGRRRIASASSSIAIQTRRAPSRCWSVGDHRDPRTTAAISW